MAAASDDEEMNYWPGFVDALSTMTMMLIFLMLILSLVIISVSQNVSRAQVMAIAKAAKVDTSGTPASLENLTQQIISALARTTEPADPKAPVPEKDPKQETVLVEPSAKLRVAERENLAVDEGNKVVSRGMEDSAISNGKSSISTVSVGVDPSPVPSSNPPKSSQMAELEPMSGQREFTTVKPRDPDTRIVSTKPADLERFGGGVDMKADKAMLTLVFPPRALRFDENAITKLTDFLDRNVADLAGRTVTVRALANIGDGTVTEARRFAYYRAMTVRQALIDRGIATKNVALTVIDVSSPEKDDLVELTAN